MRNTIMTVRGCRFFAAIAPVPFLWLIFGFPRVQVLWVLAALLGVALLAAAFRVASGTSARSMADVIEDVDTEAPPIAVRPTSAVSLPRYQQERP